MEYAFKLLVSKLNKLQQSQEQLDIATNKLLADLNTLQQDIEKLVPKPTSH